MVLPIKKKKKKGSAFLPVEEKSAYLLLVGEAGRWPANESIQVWTLTSIAYQCNKWSVLMKLIHFTFKWVVAFCDVLISEFWLVWPLMLKNTNHPHFLLQIGHWTKFTPFWFKAFFGKYFRWFFLFGTTKLKHFRLTT